MSSALETLRRDFGGDIIEPGGAEYESASRSLLASGSPAYVLRPESVGDVQAGVRFAARAGLLLSVRGGGHGFPGFGTNDGGVVIDLGKLANVEIIDKERHLVRIGGGATWGQVAAALAPHGLAISSGDTKSVGVGGLTLTGGIGWKVRKYGLALDNVVAAEVVTAGGAVVRASAEENPELFWAIRGGGGNFGIVTAFEFAAHPTTDVFYGKIAFPASEAAAVLQGWADYLRTAPDELTSTVDLANPFGGGPDAPVEIHVAFDGDDPELAAQAIDPIRRLGTVIDDDVALQPYADTLADGAPPPPGLQFALRSAFVDKESVPEVLQILAEVRASERSPFIAVRSVGGAVSRVPDDATAYAHRQAELMFVTTTAGPKPVVEAAASCSGSDLGETRTSRQRRLRQLPHVCHRGGCRRDLPNGDLSSGSRRSSVSTTPATCSPQPQRPAALDLGGQASRRPRRDSTAAPGVSAAPELTGPGCRDADAVSGPGSEESRRPGGDRLRERLELGHQGSHIVVESAGQLERGDIVGRMDEDGRGPPLAQPAGHRVEPGLPSRDGTCRVVQADVPDDGIGSQGPGPTGQAWLLRLRLPLGVARRRAAEQDGGVEGHPFGADVTESPLELLFRPGVLEERAVPYLDAVPVLARETAQETGQST